MTRQRGIELLELYDGKFSDVFIHQFCDYLEITYVEFWRCIDKYVNKKLFKHIGMGQYEKKFVTGQGI